MRYIGLLLALCLLAFIANDVIYMAERWADFKSDDAARHIQFQAAGVVVAIWHCWLTWRAWDRPVHGRLLLSFLGLFVLAVLFFLFLPLFRHDGVSGGPVFLGASLLAAIGVMAWGWRVAGAPNNSFKPKPHRGGA